MATMSPAERFVDRWSLEPAESQDLGDAALLDQLAVADEHLDRSGSA